VLRVDRLPRRNEKEPTMFDTILVAVDGRDGGRDALTLASVFADLWDANLVAMRSYARRDSRRRVPRLEARLRRDAEIGLGRDLSATGVTRAAPFVVGGPTAADALRRTAEAVEADLVVVGASRDAAARVAGADDMVSAVLDGARYPVAVAVPETRGRKLPPDAIAVGTPETDSPAPLELAVEIARRTAAPLVLLSAVDMPGDLQVDGFFVEEVRDRYRQVADAHASDVSDRFGIAARGMTVMGPPADALVDISRSVDLLVVGSHRRAPMRPRLGRTTDHVVREASCDVLVVPIGPAAVPHRRSASQRMRAASSRSASSRASSSA
jgi:nucleotide-binding universal stress UspA family protein